MHTLPARQLMSIQCSLSPPLACAGSFPQQQQTLSAHANNFACVYVCMYVHIYERVSHFSALRSPPSPPLCACYTQNKKLIASFDNQLHLAHGCLDALHAKAFAYYCSPHNRRKLANESSQRAPA